MEFANLWSKGTKQTRLSRVATRSDTSGIMSLLRTAVYNHMHVDWYLPGDWIGNPGFVVIPKSNGSSPQKTFTEKLLGPRSPVHACLAVTPDPEPAAWVRVAAIDEYVTPMRALSDMVELAADNLQTAGMESIAWLTIQDWPNQWLAKMGFQKATFIETYIKESNTLPEVPQIPNLTFRHVYENDLERLAQIEAKAFAPMWRHSARGLELARHQAFSFDVAQLEDRIVGFQLSTPSDYGAHLVRLTVDPDLHRSGIGSALLAYAFQGYHKRGRNRITLNTQIDNEASKYLYKKFGFFASGQRFPVWVKNL
jgi:ribosomal protein S18 acetylase RimI-like enzyme